MKKMKIKLVEEKPGGWKYFIEEKSCKVWITVNKIIRQVVVGIRQFHGEKRKKCLICKSLFLNSFYVLFTVISF